MDDTDYAFGRSRPEYNRLIEQAELFRPLTERMLHAAGADNRGDEDLASGVQSSRSSDQTSSGC